MTFLEPDFPKEYLDHPAEDRIAYFASLVRSHALFKKAEEKVMQTILNSERALFINVIGPTGAGKSALGRRIVRRILELKRQDMMVNRSIIPIAMARLLPPSTSRFFDLKECHLTALRALNESMLNRKVSYKIVKDKDGERLVVTGRNGSRSALRESHIETLINRKTSVFIFDDAHHFTLTANSKQIAINFEYIKNLAEESGVLHILLGTYALSDFTELSGQLIRRSVDVHFPRYHADRPLEIKSFQKILITLFRLIPLRRVFDPIEDGSWKIIYRHCIGCVGILRDWILETLKQLIEDGREQFMLDDMLKLALEIKKCLQLSLEANAGETKYLGNVSDDTAALLKELGFEEYGDAPAEAVDDEESELQKIEGLLRKEGKVSKGNLCPGQRKPERDPVGLDAEVA